MKKDTRIIIGIYLFFLLIAGFLFVKNQQNSTGISEDFVLTQENESSNHQEEAVQSSNPKEDTSKEETEKELAVYVSGAVKKPGLYRYHGTGRVCDAIEAVGGFSKNADKSSVNLARVLNDGEQICVLTKAQTRKKASQTASESSTDGSVQTDLIDINKASLDELMTLPGIGQAKAGLILNYRSENGLFAKKEDLMKVSGIKEGVYNKIKDLITIT